MLKFCQNIRKDTNFVNKRVIIANDADLDLDIQQEGDKLYWQYDGRYRILLCLVKCFIQT